jgi:pathogenesis-related protein 1
MEFKTILFIIIIVSLLIVVGILTYFLVKCRKDKERLELPKPTQPMIYTEPTDDTIPDDEPIRPNNNNQKEPEPQVDIIDPEPRPTKPKPKPQPKPQPTTPEDAIKESIKNGKSKVWVEEHNRIRNDVGLGPIKWNDEIAEGALQHSKKCRFEHSTNAQRKLGNIILGENLAYGKPYASYDDKKMVRMWESEKAFYDHPQYPSSSKKGETGHYTQIVNKRVTEFGCGCANCNGARICTCRYNPIQLGNEYPY